MGDAALWRNYSLSIVAGSVFLAAWIAFGVVKWFDYRGEPALQGANLDAGTFLLRFGSLSLENWQSEMLDVLMFVVFGALFVHRSSSQSKDSIEQVQQALARIEERLDTGTGRHAADTAERHDGLPPAPRG